MNLVLNVKQLHFRKKNNMDIGISIVIGSIILGLIIDRGLITIANNIYRLNDSVNIINQQLRRERE